MPPKKKDRAINVRVTDETYEEAVKKAQSRGSTLSRVIQSFLHLWIHDEVPPGWPPDMPEATRRAAETRPRNIKRRGKQKDEPPVE